jgi:hypothetical protein
VERLHGKKEMNDQTSRSPGVADGLKWFLTRTVSCTIRSAYEVGWGTGHPPRRLRDQCLGEGRATVFVRLDKAVNPAKPGHKARR